MPWVSSVSTKFEVNNLAIYSESLNIEIFWDSSFILLMTRFVVDKGSINVEKSVCNESHMPSDWN